jgi:NFACT protein RNA binding domain
LKSFFGSFPRKTISLLLVEICSKTNCSSSVILAKVRPIFIKFKVVVFSPILQTRLSHVDDVYVHADLHGAASVIIKNSNPGHEIPPNTLHQAGIMSVCQSKAWEAKIVTSAYWVLPDQVSKSAPTGEYLTTGSFMIRGKKNFLPPVQLVYGFGYLFKLDDASLGNHVKERRYLATDEADESKADVEKEKESKTEKSTPENREGDTPSESLDVENNVPSTNSEASFDGLQSTENSAAASVTSEVSDQQLSTDFEQDDESGGKSYGF